MSVILSLIALPLGILIFLESYSIMRLPFSIPFVGLAGLGALVLIIVQIFSYVFAHSGGNGTIRGAAIKTALALPGILYFIGKIVPIALPFPLEVLIAAFLFTEGIYGLH
jgi:hypothetical protein